jgi:diguanylate cyclase (GGDEF)-like protein/putative nucleotidyltransferase with HDIG domain
MADRHGGEAVAGAETAPLLLAPGLAAATVLRWVAPGLILTMAAFFAVSAPHLTSSWGRAPGALVWCAVSLTLARGAWVARSSSEAEAERRFWGFLAAAAVCLALSHAVWAFDSVGSHAVPPLTSFSTVLDALTVLLLIVPLASLARFRQATWAARARFVVDIVAACAVFIGVLDEWLIGPVFAGAGSGPLAGALYSAYPIVGALVLAGTLRVVIGTRCERWQSWERRIAGAAGAFAFALLLTPVAYSPFFKSLTGGWSPVVVDGVLLSGLCVAVSAVVHRLAERERPWLLRPVATLEPSYGWVASVVLPSIELLAIPAFGIAAFQTVSPTERVFRLAIVGVVSALLAVRTLLAVADSEALLARADSDPLTGLLNHRLFYDTLGGEIERSSRHGDSLGLVALDIDDFGAVNSVGGHQAGDRALVEVAAAVREAVRGQDAVCRVGGDELTVILPGADIGAAFVTGRRILDGVRTVSDSAGRPLTASIGVAAFPEHARDRDRLVAAADAALYWAKRHGKDRVVLYDAQVSVPISPEDRIRELREHANLEAVRALAAAVDARDPGTQDHSRNVSALATEFARELDLDERTTSLVGVAGLLHDVGKIGVSDAVLHRRGSLTQEDRSRLWEHAPLGAQILASTAMSDILPWVRHHHERWDGAGHPDGLAGDGIPLGARIIALCEAYDSLVSGRFGRKPLTPRAALQQIDLELGGKYDPVLGERFIRMVAARSPLGLDSKGAS